MMNVRALPAWLTLVCTLGAQPRTPRSEDPERDYQDLIALLEPPAGDPPTLVVAIEKMRAFVERHGRRADHPRVPLVRTRLATACLHVCDCEEAQRQFDAVLTHAPVDPPDLRARARYGRAQALELLGNTKAARKELQSIVTEFASLRYARFAKVALARLEDESKGGARVGQPAPAFGPEPLRDLDGRPHNLRDHAGKAVALVFWTPEVASSRERLAEVIAAWRRGGGQASAVLALGVATAAPAMESARKLHGLAAVMLPCADEFAHSAVLAFRVTRLPTVVIVGPDGTVVGRDLPPLEIELVARRLH